MTIQQLSVFLAVCRTMNYTRAASEVYMSRQAVRQNITELEKELYGALFENSRNHLQLTAKGRLLRDRAVPLVDEFYALQHTMNADIRLDRPIRLGVSVALVPDYLPSLKAHLQRFQDSYPGLPIEEHDMKNDEVVPALLSGVLDACLVMDLCGQHDGTVRTALTRHQPGVLLRNTHPLFCRDSVNLSDLSPWTMFVPGLGKEFSPLFDAAAVINGGPDFEVLPSFYQVLFHVMDKNGLALNRMISGEDSNPSKVRTIPLRGLPPICSSFLLREGDSAIPLQLLRDWLTIRLDEEYNSGQP